MADMTPNKPYLLRAIYQWIVDNQCTPYLVLAASYPGVQVPTQFVRDGQVTLNIGPSAVRELEIGNDLLEFNARFGGVPTQVTAPLGAVVAIFAKENGQGMGFDVDTPPDPGPDSDGPEQGSSGGSKKPSLKVVK
ncbi:MAG: ClpXP protease specificity-enhancing factor [Saccharospirillum sp.]|nr:ClpXP protease specificity-enhancing factor [Saccharospirillum sp.]